MCHVCVLLLLLYVSSTHTTTTRRWEGLCRNEKYIMMMENICFIVDIPFRDEPLATICVSSYFSQCLLFMFDYIKIRFGHLYEDAYFYVCAFC